MNQKDRQRQARNLAGTVQGKLTGMATLLENGASAADVAADLRLVARDMWRELAELVGLTTVQLQMMDRPRKAPAARLIHPPETGLPDATAPARDVD